MAHAKEIRTQITSIKSTQKITRAMELVAASKMKKAQERMERPKPYAKKIRQVIRHLAESHTEYQHPYMQEHKEIKRVGFIIVSSDRGLCGGLNVNLFRKALLAMKEWTDKGTELDLCLIGRRAEHFFKRHGGHVVAAVDQLGDAPRLENLIGSIKVMLDAYDEGKMDALFIVYNEFVNTMIQKPLVNPLLPLKMEDNKEEAVGHWDYIYEPDDAKILLSRLLKRYIESQVYQGVIENIACEQSARMMAMRSATDNAGEIINELQLIYNKARQASITQEISEIVGGAAAIE